MPQAEEDRKIVLADRFNQQRRQGYMKFTEEENVMKLFKSESQLD